MVNFIALPAAVSERKRTVCFGADILPAIWHGEPSKVGWKTLECVDLVKSTESALLAMARGRRLACLVRSELPHHQRPDITAQHLPILFVKEERACIVDAMCTWSNDGTEEWCEEKTLPEMPIGEAERKFERYPRFIKI